MLPLCSAQLYQPHGKARVNKCAVESAVKHAVICHCGIYKDQCPFTTVLRDKIRNNINLMTAAQIARVDSVKGDSAGFPMVGDFLNVLREIAESVACKPAGMC